MTHDDRPVPVAITSSGTTASRRSEIHRMIG